MSTLLLLSERWSCHIWHVDGMEFTSLEWKKQEDGQSMGGIADINTA